MKTLIILFVLLAVLFSLAGFFWVRERRYLKKKTSQAMGKDVWEDILQERSEVLKKRRLFKEALEQAEKNSKS